MTPYPSMTDAETVQARVAEIKAEIAARDARIASLWPSATIREIAKAVGMAPNAVRVRARQVGLGYRGLDAKPWASA